MNTRPTLRILAVCTANRCRSPVAEVLLWRALVLRHTPAIVRSAGFLEARQPVDATMRAVMLDRGIDLGSHRSALVTARAASEADLILTMERRHARELVVMAGRHAPVHTIKGFVRLARTVPARAGVLDWLDDVTAARADAEFAGDGHDDEIADPIGKPRSVHERVVEQLERACNDVAELLSARLEQS